jgi:hypothetical protein
MRYNEDEINGMLVTLNKIYWKIPVEYADYIVAEASDIPELNGKFYILNDEIVFENDEGEIFRPVSHVEELEE